MIKRRAEGPPIASPDGAEVFEVIGLRPTGTREVSLALAVVKPGEATRRHRHGFNEVYVFIEGRGVVYVDGEEDEVVEGDCVLIPRGALHCVRNTGSSELKFWCICSPAFTEKETLVE